MDTLKDMRSTRCLREIPITEIELRDIWDTRGDGAAKFVARERDGVLAVRTSTDSLTVCASFYSVAYGRTVVRALRRFRRKADITDAALDKIKERAAALHRELSEENIAGKAALSKQARNKSKTVSELAEIYYAQSEDFKHLKNQSDRKSSIKRLFLEYAPPRGAMKGPKFGARKIGKKPIDSEEMKQWKADLLAAYDGKPFVFNRTLVYLSRMFRWLAEENYIAEGVIPRVKRARANPEETARTSMLNDKMLKAYWDASALLTAQQRDFARLLLLTGVQRRSMISKLQWGECHFHMTPPQFLFAASRPKKTRAYALPMTPRIQELVLQQPRVDEVPYVFPSSRLETPLSGFSYIKEQMDASMRKALGANYTAWSFHDLRRTVKQKLTVAGIDRRVIELVQNRKLRTESSAEIHYEVYEYMNEKAEALQVLDDIVMRIVEPEKFAEKEKKAKSDAGELLKLLQALPPEKQKALLQLVA